MRNWQGSLRPQNKTARPPLMTKLIDLTHPLEHGHPNFAWDPKIFNFKGRDGAPIRAVAAIE